MTAPTPGTLDSAIPVVEAPASASPTDARRNPAAWYARPGVIVVALGALILAAALLARTPVTGRDGDQRLSTNSSDPLGAKLLYELAGRLGWQTARDTRGRTPDSTNVIQAVLDPTVPIKPEEVGVALAHVRRGGALLLVLGDGTKAFSDSLRLQVGPASAYIDLTRGVARGCRTPFKTKFTRQALWLGSAHLLALRGQGLYADRVQGFVYITRDRTRTTVRADSGTKNARSNQNRPNSASASSDRASSDRANSDRADSGRAGTDSAPSPSVADSTEQEIATAAMIGFPYGAGRIVVAADPDIFRNDALRECSYGLDLAAAATLRFLEAGGTAPRRRIVFDEFHQRRLNNGMIGIMRRYLADVPSGHAVLQLAIAGLVLLLAAAPRVLPPRDETRVERRSPLEHVDALSRAYLQVGATRTSTRRLVRGVRRRVERGRVRDRVRDGGASRGDADDPDDAFLARVAEVKPALAGDVATVRRALNEAMPVADFRAVGKAVQHIETTMTLSRTPSGPLSGPLTRPLSR